MTVIMGVLGQHWLWGKQSVRVSRDICTDSLGSSQIIFSIFFYFSDFWSIMSISTEINNGLPIPLTWYLLILLIFRILA